MVVVAGIDISKATLDVSVSEGPVINGRSPVDQAPGAGRRDQGGV